MVDKRATHCSTVNDLKTPAKMSSVTTSSFAVLISQAVLPLVWMTPFASTCPIFFRTRFIFFRSSFMAIVWKLLALSLSKRAFSFVSWRFSYDWTSLIRSTSGYSAASLCEESLFARASARSISILNSSSSIPRSLIGSSSGKPSGNRFFTSSTDIDTFFRASGVFTAGGVKMRTAEILSIFSNVTVNSRIDTSSLSSSGLAGRQNRTDPLHNSGASFKSSDFSVPSTSSK
mmetsp:Transcript_9930/g.23517  ORF Transcript_9930/g.23517 Transcript_9930/m.23517 type:complete len:231 (+) Transcript_9930:1090-1782(+)